MAIPKESIIGFVGIGVMGQHMAGHLLEAGYKLNIYDMSKANAAVLISKGAIWSDTVADLARLSDVIISIVGAPKDVKEVYFGPKGILENVKPGSFVIEMTTSSPGLARKIYEAAREKRVAVVDAPVSGGPSGAREARLSIMVGGDRDVFEHVLPILQIMGKNIVLQGEPGSGQHCKMCNQIAIASNMLGVCEAIAYAYKSGLDPEIMLNCIETGAAASSALSSLGRRMIKDDYEGVFYVKHFVKDMEIASESAKEMNLEIPALNLALSMYKTLKEQGGEKDGIQALFKLYMGNVKWTTSAKKEVHST
jgi:3-hydroxyisobutyrate dehydrogenase